MLWFFYFLIYYRSATSIVQSLQMQYVEHSALILWFTGYQGIRLPSGTAYNTASLIREKFPTDKNIFSRHSYLCLVLSLLKVNGHLKFPKNWNLIKIKIQRFQMIQMIWRRTVRCYEKNCVKRVLSENILWLKPLPAIYLYFTKRRRSLERYGTCFSFHLKCFFCSWDFDIFVIFFLLVQCFKTCKFPQVQILHTKKLMEIKFVIFRSASKKRRRKRQS